MFLSKLIKRLFETPPKKKQTFAITMEVRRSTGRSDAPALVNVPGPASRSYSIPRRPTLDAKPDDLWVPPDKSVSIGSYVIPGGLFYFGEGLRSAEWNSPEPALINPTLPIDEECPNRQGVNITYWPSYSELTPASRAAFLEWLAGGRVDPSAYIGYVFIFFYGLERRLIVDGVVSHQARADRVVILREVRRLASIYSRNGSFNRYSQSLLEAASLFDSVGKAYETKPPTGRGWEIPANVRLALAQLVAEGKPISAGWALAWLKHSPEARWRTSAERCASEFDRLFQFRYREAHGEGLLLKPNKTRLKANYRPASASLGEVSFPVPDLPDVATLTAPLNKLQAIADRCMDELDPYSRWMGRNPDGKDSALGASLLPMALLSAADHSPLTPMRGFLDERVDGENATIIGMPELLMYWPLRSEEGVVGKADSVALAQTLEKLGFGIEPDVRFGGSTLLRDGSAAVFRLPREHPSAPSPSYRAASLLLHLAAMVTSSDGVDESERQHLESSLERSMGLSASERVRLSAHLAWVLHSKPGTAGLKKRIAVLSAEYRENVGDFLVTVAMADGHASPDEISMLTRIFKLLALDVDSVYSRVHAVSTGGEPTTRRQATAGHETAPGGTGLDMTAIEAKLAETAAVSALLSDIFSEDVQDAVPLGELQHGTSVPENASDHGRGFFDERHTSLLKRLTTSAEWSRADAESLAAELGVMLDGALELLNDVAFEKFDEAIAEGNDPLEINISLAGELLA